VNAPLFATFLLGMFWKRATGNGAFIGLISGTVAAILHHGLTLPIEAHPGLHGGWIAVVHHYPSDMAQNFWTAIWAFRPISSSPSSSACLASRSRSRNWWAWCIPSRPSRRWAIYPGGDAPKRWRFCCW
jgi:Na+/proline symporter